VKNWTYRLLGKDPEAVVVTFFTGDPQLCRRVAEEVTYLVPDSRHFVVTPQNWPQMRRELRHYRIGLNFRRETAPVVT
jgi:hypothetical protein